MKFFLFRLATLCCLLIPLSVLQAQPDCTNCAPTDVPSVHMNFLPFTPPGLCGGPETVSLHFWGPNYSVGDVVINLGNNLVFDEVINTANFQLISITNGGSEFIVRPLTQFIPPDLQFTVHAKCELWNDVLNGNETVLYNNVLFAKSCYQKQLPGAIIHCMNTTSDPFDVNFTRVTLQEGAVTVDASMGVPFIIERDLEIYGNHCEQGNEFIVNIELPDWVEATDAIAEITFQNYPTVGLPVQVNGNTLTITVDSDNPSFTFNGFCSTSFPGGMGEATIRVGELYLKDCEQYAPEKAIFTIDNCTDMSCNIPAAVSTSFIYIDPFVVTSTATGLNWQILDGDPSLDFCCTSEIIRFNLTNTTSQVSTNIAADFKFYEWMTITRFRIGYGSDPSNTSEWFYNDPGGLGIENMNLEYNIGFPYCFLIYNPNTRTFSFNFECANPASKQITGLNDLDANESYSDLKPGESFFIDFEVQSGCPFSGKLCDNTTFGDPDNCFSSLPKEMEDPPVIPFEGKVYWNNACRSLPQPASASISADQLKVGGVPIGYDLTNQLTCVGSPDMTVGGTNQLRLCVLPWKVEGMDNPYLFDLGQLKRKIRISMQNGLAFKITELEISGFGSAIQFITEIQPGVFEVDLGNEVNIPDIIPPLSTTTCIDLTISLVECNEQNANLSNSLKVELIGYWERCENASEPCEVLFGCAETEMYPICDCFPVGGNWDCSCSTVQTLGFTARRNMEGVEGDNCNECSAYACDEVILTVLGTINADGTDGYIDLIGGFTAERPDIFDVFVDLEAKFVLDNQTYTVGAPSISLDPASYGVTQPVYRYIFKVKDVPVGTSGVIDFYMNITGKVNKDYIEALPAPGSVVVDDLRGFVGTTNAQGMPMMCAKAGAAEWFILHKVESLEPRGVQGGNATCQHGFNGTTAGLIVGYEGGGISDEFPCEIRPINKFVNNLTLSVVDANGNLIPGPGPNVDQLGNPIDPGPYIYRLYSSLNGGGTFFPTNPTTGSVQYSNPYTYENIESILGDYGILDKTFPFEEWNLTARLGGYFLGCEQQNMFIRFDFDLAHYAYANDPSCQEIEHFVVDIPINLELGNIETYPNTPEIVTSCPNSFDTDAEPISIHVDPDQSTYEGSWIQFHYPEGLLEIQPRPGQGFLSSGTSVVNGTEIVWFRKNYFNGDPIDLLFDYKVLKCDPTEFTITYFVGKLCEGGSQVPPVGYEDLPNNPNICAAQGEILMTVIPSSFSMEARQCNQPVKLCDPIRYSVLLSNPTMGDVSDMKIGLNIPDGLNIISGKYRYDNDYPLAIVETCNANASQYETLSSSQLADLITTNKLSLTDILTVSPDNLHGNLPGNKMAASDGYRRIHFLFEVQADCESGEIEDDIVKIEASGTKNCGDEQIEHLEFESGVLEVFNSACVNPVEFSYECVSVDYTSLSSGVIDMLLNFDPSTPPCPGQTFSLLIESLTPNVTFTLVAPTSINWGNSPIPVKIEFSSPYSICMLGESFAISLVSNNTAATCLGEECYEDVILGVYNVKVNDYVITKATYCQNGNTTDVSVDLTNLGCTSKNSKISFRFFFDNNCNGVYNLGIDTAFPSPYEDAPESGDILSVSYNLPQPPPSSGCIGLEARISIGNLSPLTWCWATYPPAKVDLSCDFTPNFSYEVLTNDGGKCKNVHFTDKTVGLCGTPTITWDFGDGTTGTGSDLVHNYAQNGVYNVTMTVTIPGCPSKFITMSVAAQCLLLRDSEADKKGSNYLEGDGLTANIYPNPASEEVTVELTAPQDEAGEMYIYDLSGKLVHTEKLELSGKLATKVNLRLNGWASGVYLMKFKGEAHTAHKQFVIR